MKVTHDNIKQFLWTPGKYFVIPDFQRPYSWDKQNVLSFLNDLESVKSGEKNHFFGSIVYISESDNSVIIDGQQRATTVLLMLTAIYHIAEADQAKCALQAEQIKESYLFNKYAQTYGSEKNRIKLRTVTTDNEVFEQIFDKKQLAEKNKESKLYKSYNIFYEYFSERANLEKYIETLDNFEIVTIALDSSDDNPQKVFESINSTGKPLSDGDKIRNFALMLNDDETRKMVLENYWHQIEQKLTDVNKDYITDFFRNYLTSKLQKDIKIENVYAEFKKDFYVGVGEDQSNAKKIEAFYGAVLNTLDQYLFLKFNDDESKLYTPLKDDAFRLSYLKIEIVYPFLIPVLELYRTEKLSLAEVKKIFLMVETFLTRRILCNFATTGLNNLFSILHKEIIEQLSEYPKESYSNVLAYVLLDRSGSTHMPTNKEVESAVSTNQFYTQRNWYNLFVLTSVDDKLQAKESTLLKQISNGDIELSIEHIMPQTLNNEWKLALGDDYQEIHDQYLHTLPNLTLTGYNSKYSNKSFDSKKTMDNGFDQSPLVINQLVKKFDVWNLDSITERSAWWKEQIHKLWPMPETTFAPPSSDEEFYFSADNDLSGTKVKSVSVLGESTKVASWADAFEIIVEKLFLENPTLPEVIATDEFLSRYIRLDGDRLVNPRQINDSGYYLETGTDTNRKRITIARLAELLEIDDADIKVVLDKAK
ncbi:MAG: DUF262 domain-containing protein [Candidatus Saccharimonadia bacterium]